LVAEKATVDPDRAVLWAIDLWPEDPFAVLPEALANSARDLLAKVRQLPEFGEQQEAEQHVLTSPAEQVIKGLGYSVAGGCQRHSRFKWGLNPLTVDHLGLHSLLLRVCSSLPRDLLPSDQTYRVGHC
jgi:hypothetical protein